MKLLILYVSFTLASGLRLKPRPQTDLHRRGPQHFHSSSWIQLVGGPMIAESADAAPMNLNKEVMKGKDSIDFVIARYSENVSWVKDIVEKRMALSRYNMKMPAYNVLLYNKGQDNVPLANKILTKESGTGYTFTEKRYGNVPAGREGHTYLRHILENYDNLAEWTIFSQGDPFEHAPGWMDEKWVNFGSQGLDKEAELQCLTCQFNATVPYSDGSSCATGPRLYGMRASDFQVVYPKPFMGKGVKHFVDFVSNDLKINSTDLAKYYMKVMDIPGQPTPPPIMDLCFSGIMIVNKKRIQRVPKQSWLNLHKWFMNSTAAGGTPGPSCDNCRSHPYRGYIVERFWFTLFGSPGRQA